MTLRFFLLLIFLYHAHMLSGQSTVGDGRFAVADAHAASIRRQYIFHPEVLAHKLTEGLHNDYDKARAIYTWIATNIDYDLTAFYNDLRSGQGTNEVLVSGKALCVGYSLLFDYFCQKSGLTSVIIDGYAKGYGYDKQQKFTMANHAWNAVNIYGTWYLLDVTWAAGDPFQAGKIKQKTMLDDFFLVAPEVLVRTHMPEDPTWQLLENKVSLEAFEKGATDNLSGFPPTDFSPKDYERLNEFDAEILKYKRSLNFNPKNYGLYQRLSFGYVYKAISITDGIHTLPMLDLLDTLGKIDTLFMSYLDSAKMTIAALEPWKIPNFNKIIADETNFQKGVFEYEMGTELFGKRKKEPQPGIAALTKTYYTLAATAFSKVSTNSIYHHSASEYLSNIREFLDRDREE
ncbi:MAG: hypothetical protein HC819_10025 [Cyclobacteriaceae bacterium]|nr:hypothetical protein [Cyclobacteriaceae bacterium]